MAAGTADPLLSATEGSLSSAADEPWSMYACDNDSKFVQNDDDETTSIDDSAVRSGSEDEEEAMQTPAATAGKSVPDEDMDPAPTGTTICVLYEKDERYYEAKVVQSFRSKVTEEWRHEVDWLDGNGGVGWNNTLLTLAREDWTTDRRAHLREHTRTERARTRTRANARAHARTPARTRIKDVGTSPC